MTIKLMIGLDETI